MTKKLSGNTGNVLKKTEPGEGFVWTSCKNCGYAFEGKFCPACGQSIVEVQKPVHHFLGDIFGSLLALDLRALRSIPLLLLKPGRLSQEYIDGKRARHVAPFRLYFFTSVVFFFLIGWQTKEKINAIGQQEIPIVDSIAAEMPATFMLSFSSDSAGLLTGGNEVANSKFLDRLQEELANAWLDSTQSVSKQQRIQQRIDRLDDPDVAVSKAYQYISWSFFVLMPWFALILFLIFRKKRKFYVEHLIYSVNLHTFFFIVLILTVLLNLVFHKLMIGAGIWIFLFVIAYSIIGIRNFYSTRWISAIFSSLGIFIIYLMSIAIIMIVSLVLLFTIS